MFVEDYDGDGKGLCCGFELCEVGGGWWLYVCEDFDDVVVVFIGG